MFSLLQDAETGGNAEDGIEVAWGIGVVLWDHPPSGETIAYPLISRTVEIQINQATMALRVTPTERDPIVHADIFEEIGATQAERVEKRALADFAASERTVSPFDPGTFDGILRFAVSCFNDAVYWPDQVKDQANRSLPPTRSYLTVTDCWVLFARKRSTNFIAADIKRLKEAVAKADALPPAPALIVTEPADEVPTRRRRRYRGLSTTGLFGGRSGGSGGNADGDEANLFFPKPFNAEQVSIIDRLDQSAGMVVQGPPGTGKTHTIANIICHYLALGKRVLVTSQHEAPLAVLQDQIPESLRPLTIALLTSEREGLKQLEQAVRKIAGEVNTLDERELDRQIHAETERIDRLHQKLAALDRELRAWAARQTAETPFLGGDTRPEALARHVAASEQEHAWFPDRLAGDDTSLPAFAAAEIGELRKSRRRLGNDLCYLGQALPTPEQLPLPEDIARLHADLRRLAALREDVIERGTIPPLRRYTTESIRELSALREDVVRAQAHLRAGSQVEWTGRVRPLLAEPASSAIAPHLKRWIKETLELERVRQSFIGDAIEIPTEAEAHAGVYDAVQRAAAGRKPFPLFGGNKDAKALVAQIRLRARAPTREADWQRLLDYLDAARQGQGLLVQWEQMRHEFDGPAVSGSGLASVKALYRHARAGAALWQLDAKLAEPLRAKTNALFADGSAFGGLTESLDQLDRLLSAIVAHLEHSRLKAAVNSREEIQAYFADRGGPVAADGRRFIEAMLGNDAISAEQCMDVWQELLAALRRIAARQGELRTWRKLKGNMTSRISAALQAYLTALTHIGRGTGVRATRYRKDARQAMGDAYAATPCWIMAQWRVSEALPPQLGLFDPIAGDPRGRGLSAASDPLQRCDALPGKGGGYRLDLDGRCRSNHRGDGTHVGAAL